VCNVAHYSASFLTLKLHLIVPPLIMDYITVTHHSVVTANTNCSLTASCNREERIEKSVGEILSSVVVEIVSNKGEIWIFFMLRCSVDTIIICIPLLPTSLPYSPSCQHPLQLLSSPPPQLSSLLFSPPPLYSSFLFASPFLYSSAHSTLLICLS
jgi:hypothetical protein